MTQERYQQLNDVTVLPKDLPKLTEEEKALGWHYCAEWDELLVGPGMGELECCRCLDMSHPVYQTTPARE